jgi:hypothetical protein
VPQLLEALRVGPAATPVQDELRREEAVDVVAR